MASKRKHHQVANDYVTTYFIDQIHKWNPMDATRFSFHDKKLIVDANAWGEARVRSEMLAMQLAGMPAAQQNNRLRSDGEEWYACGYRMYLLPNSFEVPDAIRSASSLETNPRLAAMSEQTRRTEASAAARIWWRDHSSAIRNAASVAVAEEGEAQRQHKEATATAAASPATAPATSPRKRSPLPQMATTTTRPTRPLGPQLPEGLRRLLASPAEHRTSAPRTSIRPAVTAAFHAQRMLRVWEDGGANNRPRRAFQTLERPAYHLQQHLDKNGLSHVYGRGKPDETDRCMTVHAGLKRIGGGASNAIWVAGENGSRVDLGSFLPPQVLKPFLAGRLVLRTPHVTTDWLSFEHAVGEATNMLFTAMCGCGPQVALLSYARRLFTNETNEEGVQVVKYKLFAFLERANESADERYALNVPPLVSAHLSGTYYHALLVCIYQYSQEGFVHLDGTLRNYVDLYPHNLPSAIDAWQVRVIDVEEKLFRRLCPQASTDWRDLFLVNLLVVLSFLKLRLGCRWDKEWYWLPVRNAAEHLIGALRGRKTLPAIAYWDGTFKPEEPFPHVDTGKFAGDTHEAAARVLVRVMRYYLMKQHIEQGTMRYVNKLHSHKSTAQDLSKAKAWYDNVYRIDMYPSLCFFREALLSRQAGHPRLLVSVLFEFLDKEHKELCVQYVHRLPTSNIQQRGATREVLLGL